MRVLIIEDRKDSYKPIRNALYFGDGLSDCLRNRGIHIDPPQDADIVWIKSRAEFDGRWKEIRESQSTIDLIILDLLLTDDVNGPLEGFEIFEKLRNSLERTVPIVLYSNFLHQKTALDRIVSMLVDRRLIPPSEMLSKVKYPHGEDLAKVIYPFFIELDSNDIDRLNRNQIQVPAQGETRKLLRELKRLACSVGGGIPSPDVLLLGENGVGKTTFGKAYHLLRPMPLDKPRLEFTHLDLGALDLAGSAPNIALFGATDFNNSWSLGAFAKATLYSRNNKLIGFPGQTETAQLPDGKKGGDVWLEKEKIGADSYPETLDKVDYEGSGTLFLDEVVNIRPEIQKMLLQAISYDVRDRHVYTTGHAPRRLKVGPSLIFATSRWDEATARSEESGTEKLMRDYLFRIDQRRVTVPPLRQREFGEIEDLLSALVKKRFEDDRTVSIDPVAKSALKALVLRNNVADLQRIVDQMTMEDSTIRWQHVAPVFDRERPITRIESPEKKEEARGEYLQAREALLSLRAQQPREPLSRLAKQGGVRFAYNVGLVFLDDCNCAERNNWPRSSEIEPLFGQNPKAFRTYMHRISRHRNTSFTIEDALKDLQQLKYRSA